MIALWNRTDHYIFILSFVTGGIAAGGESPPAAEARGSAGAL